MFKVSYNKKYSVFHIPMLTLTPLNTSILLCAKMPLNGKCTSLLHKMLHLYLEGKINEIGQKAKKIFSFKRVKKYRNETHIIKDSFLH
jgi:hypothetical protein